MPVPCLLISNDLLDKLRSYSAPQRTYLKTSLHVGAVVYRIAQTAQPIVAKLCEDRRQDVFGRPLARGVHQFVSPLGVLDHLCIRVTQNDRERQQIELFRAQQVQGEGARQ